MMARIWRLVVRDIRANTNAFMLMTLIFPILYLAVAGVAFNALIPAIDVQDLSVSYLAFLAIGTMVMSLIANATRAGGLVWGDRRTGMLDQILMGPFTRNDYVAAKILSTAIATVAVSMPVVVGGVFVAVGLSVSGPGLLLVASVLVLGALFFGSVVIALAVSIRSQEIVSFLMTVLFYLLIFGSSILYPSQLVGGPLGTLIELNPTSYVANLVRVGVLGLPLDASSGRQLVALVGWSLAAVSLAALALRRLRTVGTSSA